MKVSEMDGEFLGNKMSVDGGLDPKNPAEKLVFREEATQLASLGPVYDEFAPGLHDLKLGGAVSAVLNIWLTEQSFQSEGTLELDGVEATVGEFTLADLTGPMQIAVSPEGQTATTEKISGTIGGAPLAMKMELRANPDRGRIDPLTVNAFSGQATLLTTLVMGGTNKFRSELVLANMRVEEMIPALAPDLKDSGLSGLLESGGGEVRGVLDETMTESLKGDLNFRFVDGVLEGVNVAKESLGKMTELPFVSGAIATYLPDRYKEALTSDRTVLNVVSGTFKLKDEIARTKDLYVESTYFTMDGKGDFGMDSSVNLDATIRFTEEFSSALAKSLRELEYIYQDGRLVLPVHVEGISPDLKITPDMSGLLKSGLTNAVKDEVRKAVEDEIKDQVQDSIGDQVGDVLNNLLED